ncbi:uncharacterized protein SCDLUD_000239 [Saccharomycodes ludwigii]|uniref:uncharacterized protein n=1 Tax=Saccharomycodes ludwigii TaxID=36035 RepID=UPI001E89D8AD|nr:hypothetical protein SCDLUD_000239 [Saccharomycodes ludwigii]KAH3902657.1 hypothetical protein SCDLUD_000239 [Saccharomycodes ludwigii]
MANGLPYKIDLNSIGPTTKQYPATKVFEYNSSKLKLVACDNFIFHKSNETGIKRSKLESTIYKHVYKTLNLSTATSGNENQDDSIFSNASCNVTADNAANASGNVSAANDAPTFDTEDNAPFNVIADNAANDSGNFSSDDNNVSHTESVNNAYKSSTFSDEQLLAKLKTHLDSMKEHLKLSNNDLDTANVKYTHPQHTKCLTDIIKNSNFFTTPDEPSEKSFLSILRKDIKESLFVIKKEFKRKHNSCFKKYYIEQIRKYEKDGIIGHSEMCISTLIANFRIYDECIQEVKDPMFKAIFHLLKSLPTSSVASERTFSQLGSIYSDRRDNLSSEHAKLLLKLKLFDNIIPEANLIESLEKNSPF